MKFVHAADIHLDSPLRGLERYGDAPLEAIRGATRRAFKNLVDLCLEEEAKLLLIAGDLYDGDWRDFDTGLFLVRQLGRLTSEGIRVVLLYGNHDAESVITKKLPLPKGAVALPSRKPKTVRFEDLGVAVHGQSYPDRRTTEDIAAGYPEPVPGFLNIGLLHTALDGRPGHEPYAPCRVEELAEKGYDYWALGHVHAREIVSEHPWIVFPGNLQGRYARETGPKGATVVTVSEDRSIERVEPVELDVVRWARCEVDATGAEAADDVLDLVRRAIGDASAIAGNRVLAARVVVRGATPAARELASDRRRWTESVRAIAADLPEVWVERVEFRTCAPLWAFEAAKGDGPVAELLRTVLSLRDHPEELVPILRDDEQTVDLKRKLPREYQELEDAIDFDDPGSLADLLDGVGDLLAARLTEGGDR